MDAVVVFDGAICRIEYWECTRTTDQNDKNKMETKEKSTWLSTISGLLFVSILQFYYFNAVRLITSQTINITFCLFILCGFSIHLLISFPCLLCFLSFILYSIFWNHKHNWKIEMKTTNQFIPLIFSRRKNTPMLKNNNNDNSV